MFFLFVFVYDCCTIICFNVIMVTIIVGRVMIALKKYTEEELLNVNALDIAFVGDAVFSLYVREVMLTKHISNLNMLTVNTSKVVNAGNQYKLFRLLEPSLTPYEAELAHRARNSNIRSKAKNYSVTEYIYATAFEAIIGYLYLTGQEERLDMFLKECIK